MLFSVNAPIDRAGSIKPSATVADLDTVRVVLARLARAYAAMATWAGDIADPQHMARLRSRVLVAGGLAGALSMAASWALERDHYGTISPWMVVGVFAGLLAITADGWLRGQSMRDLEFAVVLVLVEAFTAVAVLWGQGPGQVASTAMNLVITVIVGAVFLERSRLVVLLLATAVVMLVAVARTSAPGSGALIDVSSGTFNLLAATAVVRLLRDTAVEAVRRARAGEVTDPLTGLPNRAGLERLGGRLWRARARDGETLVVLALDVDHFKRINDEQGHAAGDATLRRLAGILLRSIRADDLPARIGGEEFLVLCIAPASDGPDLGERLRAAVAADPGGVTVSIGVHVVRPSADDVLPEAIWAAVDVADRALYVAKRDGRNRVRFST